jgi:hypothetical protein
MGRSVPGDHPGVAGELGIGHPVPGVPARGPPRHRDDEGDRGAQPPAPQSGQNQRPFSQRGRRPHAALPRHPQRRPAMDENPKLDDRTAGVQDPLRRPPTRLAKPAYTENGTPSGVLQSTWLGSRSAGVETPRRSGVVSLGVVRRCSRWRRSGWLRSGRSGSCRRSPRRRRT